MTINYDELCPTTKEQTQALVARGELDDHQQDLGDSQGFTAISTAELCETTQRHLNELLEQEEHLEHAAENLAITDIKTVEGRPVQLKDIKPDTLITVDGITGQADHLIEAGVLSKSIYAGSYEEYLEDAEDCFEVPEESEGTQGTREHITPEALSTASQIEDAIGSANTIETVTTVLAGEDLSADILAGISESYGVSPERAAREIYQTTEQLYNDFAGYAEDKLGVEHIDHLAEWVAHAADQNTRIKQLYQQAIVGAFSGDFRLSRDLVQEYRKYYRMF
ncbi:hypothetical protein [Salinimonas chungwhensis]|uniref:hypothetical protein n=1 Tax=Salinimonas chungwhensis TaxID=265425 RepID=UPI00036D356C|nr:hypothetical protein [Salinimonas chungwhensis]